MINGFTIYNCKNNIQIFSGTQKAVYFDVFASQSLSNYNSPEICLLAVFMNVYRLQKNVGPAGPVRHRR
jgi:hypothetical protein